MPLSHPIVGVVLGAGGVRGSAHAAVMKTLHEADIPIHLVVGASTGALYGLGLAAGMPVEELARLARAATPRDLRRFYLGRLRPSRTNPIGRLLLEAGTGKQFSDLDLPFAVTATDILTGEQVVLDT
ncbi:MAG: patatin-like phospholipase family protein, partial [Chloroflexota bacterium]|nr:patatin-like phospholipase family protein [Chloroflexota bacterium]